jgi:hypothetical protein
MYQKIDPYFTRLMKGRKIAIEMDLFIAEGNTAHPHVYLSEARDYNVHWTVAQTYLEDLEPAAGALQARCVAPGIGFGPPARSARARTGWK